MVMFDNIEEIFQELRDYNEYSKALVTLATAIGAIIILYYTFKIFYQLIQGIRLYVLSQLSCCQTNYIERYGKWVVISGSTDGIGQAMAKEFARRGHSIIVIGRNDEKLARTKEMLEQEDNVGEVEIVKIDLSDSSLENFDRIKQQIDPENRDIGILINNAGLFHSKFQRFNRNDIKFFKDLINVNILASVYLTRIIMPGMVERQKGLIVNVSSIMGNQPIPYTNVYSQTKCFINSFSEGLQQEYSSHPIDIINLTPGPVHTKLFIDTKAISNPSFINPTPEDYAKSSINAFSTRIKTISGTLFHGLMSINTLNLYNLGLLPIFMKLSTRYIYTESSNLSPVMKRKKRQATSNVSQQATNDQENVFNRTIET